MSGLRFLDVSPSGRGPLQIGAGDAIELLDIHVNGITANSGSFLGGDTVVLAGVNLSFATGVTFNGIPAASFTVDSDEQITAVTPYAGDTVGAGSVAVSADIVAGDDAGWTFSVLLGAIEYWTAARYLSNNGGTGNITGAKGVADHTVAGGSTDPVFLYPQSGPGAGSNYFWLPGVTGNELTVPDSSALSITGDIAIVAWLRPDDWSPGTQACLLSKGFSDTGTGTQSGAYDFQITTAGALRLSWVNSSNVRTTALSTSNLPWATDNDTYHAVAATLDVDSAGVWLVRFYRSDSGSTWVQHGNNVAGGATTNIKDTQAVVRIGTLNWTGATPFNPFRGKLYKLQIYNGIPTFLGGAGGTTVLNILPNSGGHSTFTESSSNAATVTVVRTGTGPTTSFVDEAKWVGGTDDMFSAGDVNAFDFGGAQDFTVSSWQRSFGLDITPLGKCNATDGWKLSTVFFAPYFQTLDGGTSGIAPGLSALPAGVRRSFIGVRDAGVSIKLYVNGVQEATSSTNTNLDTSNAVALRAFTDNVAVPIFSNMEWHGAAIFNVALSAAQALYLHSEV